MGMQDFAGLCQLCSRGTCCNGRWARSVGEAADGDQQEDDSGAEAIEDENEAVSMDHD